MDVRKGEVSFLNDPTLRKSEQIFDGKILQVYKNEIEIDEGLVVERELIHHQPAVAVLPITEKQEVILVKQYRPAIVQAILEIPAGLLDRIGEEYEAPIIGAKRELEEETGYQAKQWEYISEFYLSPGYLNEKITFFTATDLQEVAEPLAADEDERIEIFYFSVDEVKNLLKNDEIIDIKTLYALQYWLNSMN